MLLRMLFCLLLFVPTLAKAAVKVVASTSDLAYYAEQIGGDLLEVKAVASPRADLHYVEARPSNMVSVAKADVVLKVGLELDMWMDGIIDGSHNAKLVIVDCSKYIHPLEVPTFKADARYGDLHRFGNPHYWLSPDNLDPITRAIVEGLSQVDPDNAPQYEANRGRFLAEVDSGLTSLQPMMEQLRGQSLVCYHNSWPYFNQYTGLKDAGFIEPYPGVPPSPSHIKEIIDLINLQKIKVIAVEPYFDKRVPDKIASATGAKVITLYPSIGGREKNESYIDWVRGNVNALYEAFQ